MRSVEKLLTICLIAGLSGCAHPCWDKLKKDGSVYEIDVVQGVCGRHKILSFTPFKTKWVEDLPLSSCDGYFALSPRDQLRLQKCAEDAAGECK